jgi:hypothetical protein
LGIADWGLRIGDCGLGIADWGLRIGDFEFVGSFERLIVGALDRWGVWALGDFGGTLLLMAAVEIQR